MENDTNSQAPDQQTTPTTPSAVPPQPGALTAYSSAGMPPVERHVPHVASPVATKVEEEKRGSWVTSRWFRWVIVLLIAPALAFYVQDKLHGGLSDQTLSYSGYTYSFKFYSRAGSTVAQGVPARKYGQAAAAYARSSGAIDDLGDCSDAGDDWSQAFTATINGSERPVCTSIVDNIHYYVVLFPAFNVTQAFSVAYYSSDKDAAKLISDTGTLQKIFSSVKVSR